jgi:signal transduction histidine kinase
LLFPDGRLPSSRWRWFAWSCGIGLALLYLAILLSADQGVDFGLPQVVNPLAIDALQPTLRSAVVLAPLVSFAPLTVIGGATALIRRLRRTTDPVQRRQLRWLAWAAALMASAYALAFLPMIVLGERGRELADLFGSIAVFSFLLIPITIGIAVLRYRLFDIDIVIRKTVVVAVLVAFIAIVYVAVVVGVGALVGSSGDPVLSAIAAAVVAIVFQPVRARARRLADRVVYGKRATPYELLQTFGGQLAGTYSADDVLPRIARVLGEGVGAQRSRVWLRVGDDLRMVASWPDEPSDGPDDLTTEVLHRGEELGALSVAMPANDPMDPAKEELVRDLAAQAGLVLSNVRLTEELRARLGDLQAAQKRLVTAQDAERKRLERDIHDGAQQQLVALAVQLKLADTLVDRDRDKAHHALARLQQDTAQALEDLRDLARGIYPPLLADKGIVAALEAQARRSPLPVTVEGDGVGRLDPEVEAAVYFSCLEALQNAAKYAEASSAVVRVRTDAGELVFEVRDDGRGFDTLETNYGTGLQGIADRLGALEGRLEVESASGLGTTVRGQLPVGSRAADPMPPGAEPDDGERAVLSARRRASV